MMFVRMHNIFTSHMHHCFHQSIISCALQASSGIYMDAQRELSFKL